MGQIYYVRQITVMSQLQDDLTMHCNFCTEMQVVHFSENQHCDGRMWIRDSKIQCKLNCVSENSEAIQINEAEGESI